MRNFNKIFYSLFISSLTIIIVSCGGGSGSTYFPSADVVAVTGGLIAASNDSTANIRVFKGIPFAAPPVGNLRWKSPQPVVAWSGIKQNNEFANSCLMGNRPAGIPGAILYQVAPAQSEDCLYLNVWTPAGMGSKDKRPVMVLLHGGGYLLGSGSQANYNGTGLASKGAIVVTLNYRLGALGFLAHPELSGETSQKTSGNYALLDAISVLKWVQNNISNFGGDTNNVTIYSQSAGSGLSSVLLASPLSKGLFHKIVNESFANLPAGAPNPTLSQAEAAGLTFANNLKAQNLSDLRNLTGQQIMAGAGFINGPIVDGYVQTDQLDLLFKSGSGSDVPMLVGWNSDEGTPYPPFATTLAAYNTAVTSKYATMSEQFKQVYPVNSDADVLAMAYSPMRDNLFAWQAWTLARSHAANYKSKTFLYFFNRKPSYFASQHFTEIDPPYNYGAYHSLEQVYFYNNLSRSEPSRAYTTLDNAIADTASSYLINFVNSGDPNSISLPSWPSFTGSNSQSMYIGDTISPGVVPNRKALDFFDAFYSSTLRPLPF